MSLTLKCVHYQNENRSQNFNTETLKRAVDIAIVLERSSAVSTSYIELCRVSRRLDASIASYGHSSVNYVDIKALRARKATVYRRLIERIADCLQSMEAAQ